MLKNSRFTTICPRAKDKTKQSANEKKKKSAVPVDQADLANLGWTKLDHIECDSFIKIHEV